MNNLHPNVQLITQFYQAFQRLDAEAMCACYASSIHFSDPVFTDLNGDQAGDMWRMLCSRAKDFSLQFDSVEANDQSGSAHWVATYVFSQTGRIIVNDIQASFVFKDGKIIEHCDHFDLWKWSRQALGFKGLLLGWSGLVKNKIRHQAMAGLKKFRQAKS